MTLNDEIVGFEGACNKIIECEDYQEMNRASFRHVLSLDHLICLPSSVDSSRFFFCPSFLTFISQPCAIFAIVTVAAARRANIKEHQPGWGDDALSDFAIGQTEWPDCLIIPTFPGKYPIADQPGVCCRTDDRMWSCWAD